MGRLRVAPPGGASTAAAHDGDFPDPFVTRVPDGRYVAWSTQVGGLNVPVRTSYDLRSWTEPSDALPRLPPWAAWGHTWAPAVARRGQEWVMWYTTRHAARGIQCISVATAGSATGPYRDDSDGPFVCQRRRHGSIDPSPFVAPDGSLYLHWKSEDNAAGGRSVIWGQRLSDDGLRRVGREVPLLRYEPGTWEDPLIEGPSMALVGRDHHLFYGGGWWESDRAAIGHAVCAGPLGPCARPSAGGPWMAGDETRAGPAGPALFTPDGGRTWLLAYHAWEPGRVGYGAGGRRALWIDAVDLSGATPVVR